MLYRYNGATRSKGEGARFFSSSARRATARCRTGARQFLRATAREEDAKDATGAMMKLGLQIGGARTR